MITYRTAQSYFQICRINREVPTIAGLAKYSRPGHSYIPNVRNGQRIVIRVVK